MLCTVPGVEARAAFHCQEIFALGRVCCYAMSGVYCWRALLSGCIEVCGGTLSQADVGGLTGRAIRIGAVGHSFGYRKSLAAPL
jgi:hypothetical protein